MPKLDFAFLAHAAMVDNMGLISVLGAGISLLRGPQFPLRQQLTLVGRVTWKGEEADIAHVLRVLVMHPDGETLHDEHHSMPAVGLPPDPDMESFSGFALPLALEVRRPALYHVVIRLDGDEMARLPLRAESLLPQPN